LGSIQIAATRGWWIFAKVWPSLFLELATLPMARPS